MAQCAQPPAGDAARDAAASAALAGELQLSAYDVSLSKTMVIQFMAFDGALPVGPLAAGLRRALDAYPLLDGWMEARGDGSVVARWQRDVRPAFAWSHAVRSGRLPSVHSTWEVWCADAMPAASGRLAAAKATTFPDVGKSLLVFAFDHSIFDWPVAFSFMQLWFREAGAIASTLQLQLGLELQLSPAGSAAASPRQQLDLARAASQQSCQSADLCVEVFAPSPSSCKKLRAGSGNLGDSSCCAVGSASGFERMHTVSPASSYAAARRAFPDMPPLDDRQACRAWLAKHRGDDGPFAWDALERSEACRQSWQMLGMSFDLVFTAITLRREVVDAWKAAADAEAPLPDGQWYSANTAMQAFLAATIYAADPEPVRRRGGLHVTSVVDARGGRFGLGIPRDFAGNASIWGVRIWVPERMLAEAAAKPSPALMHHLRTQLLEQLADPQGPVSQQAAFWEVIRGAGLSCHGQVCHALLQTCEGDVMLDCLPASLADLPPLPGVRTAAASVRWLPSWFPNVGMVLPVPRAGGGYDCQLEITLRKSQTAAVWDAWRALGVDMSTLRVPAQQSRGAVLGWYWDHLDVFTFPYGLSRCVVPLLDTPRLLGRAALGWLSRAAARLVGRAGGCAAKAC